MGHVVQIRSEKDPKKIRQMTKSEIEIRKEWLKFKNKVNKKIIKVSNDNIDKVLSSIFK